MSCKEELIMILKHQIITDIRIESVNDLYKLKPFLEDGTLKINKSQIARELEVDRRTVDKYINGYTKPETRNCDDCITPFYDTIAELLSDKNQQVFYYRKVLWQYLVDNHGFTGVYCNFCHYLRKYPEFDSYFRKSRPSNTNKVTIRYETPMGKQAQLDWKESIPFILSSGETIDVNIFVLLLSYSRFRVYRVSLSKNQEILFSFLDDAFETGKVNNKFQQFADDYGFKVQPCIARHPHTKAKVEAPMKILDEIRAYNGKLNYMKLVELVTRINNRVNAQVNQGTGRIPLMYYNKEKAFLNSLPADNIRKPYQIATNTVKVNHSSMFNYKGCQYSVPPEYIDKIVSLQVYDGYIHVYCNTEFITIHQLSSKKLNYISEHYAAIARKSHIFRDEHIMDRAKENLEIIGKVYDYE
jgi:transposase